MPWASSPRSRLAAAALALGTLLFAQSGRAAAPPDAATRSAARDLAQQGGRLYKQGECKKAVDLFDRAYKLVPAPTIELLKARCLVKLGRFLDATDAYEKVLHTDLGAHPSKPFVRAVAEAKPELAALRPRIPELKVSMKGPGASLARVTLDGHPVPPELVGVERPIDPGHYELSASAPGATTAHQTVSVAEGQHYVVVLHLAAAGASAPPPRPSAPGTAPAHDLGRRGTLSTGSTQRTWGWVGLGVGAAGLVTGVVTALMAGSRKSTLDGECSGRVCPPSAKSDLDTYRTLRTTSIVGYVVGFAGSGAGAVLLLIAPKRTADASRLQPYVGLATAGVRGTF